MSTINDLWNKFKTHAIYILIIAILVVILGSSVNRCSNVSKEYENNIAALNDTIKYYQDKNGNLVATKLAFESDVNTLKLLNERLYNQIDSLKLNKNSVAQIIYVDGEINNPKQDTAFIIKNDTVSKGFYRTFDFNNEYRTLEGNVDYHNDSLGIAITKDVIRFDYTVAMDKNNRIYIKSTNPYVTYNEISGFTVSQPKTKRWSLDAFGNINYSPIDNDRFYDIGLSLGYSLSKVTIGPKMYFEHNLATKNKTFYIGGALNLNILKW